MFVEQLLIEAIVFEDIAHPGELVDFPVDNRQGLAEAVYLNCFSTLNSEFLNVFIAAAMPEFATQILQEDNPRAFGFDDAGLWWHDLRVTCEELVRVREDFAISFGSCSFEEPLREIQEYGWL